MINVLLFRKEQRPEIIKIERNIDSIGVIISGNIQISKITNDLCIIHNEKLDYKDIYNSNFIVSAIDQYNNLQSMDGLQLNYALSSVINLRNQKSHVAN